MTAAAPCPPVHSPPGLRQEGIERLGVVALALANMLVPGEEGGVFPWDRVPSQCSSFTSPRCLPHSQLIEDKKTLGEKCQAVLAELKQGDQRHKEREAQMQDQHQLVRAGRRLPLPAVRSPLQTWGLGPVGRRPAWAPSTGRPLEQASERGFRGLCTGRMCSAGRRGGEPSHPEPRGARGACRLASPRLPQLPCQPPVFSPAGDQEAQGADERH